MKEELEKTKGKRREKQLGPNRANMLLHTSQIPVYLNPCATFSESVLIAGSEKSTIFSKHEIT